MKLKRRVYVKSTYDYQEQDDKDKNPTWKSFGNEMPS